MLSHLTASRVFGLFAFGGLSMPEKRVSRLFAADEVGRSCSSTSGILQSARLTLCQLLVSAKARPR